MVLTALAVLCILFMIVSLLLHIFGLPANWLVLFFAALWTFFAPGETMTVTVLAIMAALAVAGEIMEALMLHIWGKKYGGSNKGTIAGMVGAIIGAILCAPILFGIGAFFGALGGAFLGSLAMELYRGLPSNEAVKAAWGTMIGRFGGTVTKAALGCTMVVIAAPRIWGS
ncbi:DUF456 domain-containing protein [Desulfovibrio sp. OttesenSCG-928-O18]|nr:DUF456 domain-containing protein [Desulfovibrio sp. OttesenSCG-928-O18]